MAALDSNLLLTPLLRRDDRSSSPPASLSGVAPLPSTPPALDDLGDMLSPTHSPTSPTVSSKAPLSPPPAASTSARAQSHPASPTPLGHPPSTLARPTAATTSSTQNATATMSATSVATPTPVSASSNNNTPPTKKVLERNQACLGCRQRKRKCDGGKPACGACERLERTCVYTHNTVTKIHSSSHYRDHASSASRPGAGSKSSAAHEPSSLTARNPSTPSRAVPGSNRQSSVPGGSAVGAAGFTAVNMDGTSRPTRLSPPVAGSRLSPHVTNGGNAYSNPRKRSFSSLDSSPAIGGPHHGSSSTSPTELDATTFAVRFLQAAPFAGLNPVDITPPHHDEMEDLPELSEDGLPNPELLRELFVTFLDKWHSVLPCLYKNRTLSEIEGDGPLTKPNTLTFAILALAGYLHPSPSVKTASHKWAELGQVCFDRAVAEGRFTMQAVQGGIYLCLRMFGLGQMSSMWIFLGSVWRMCLPLGFHQIDAHSAAHSRGFLPDPKSELELEERRRTVWAVYILDRLISTSVPWSMCVVDSEFCVNFPASEEVFQNGSMESMDHMIIDPFPGNNLESLLPPTTMASATGTARDAYQHLCKLAVLLGRILSFTRSTRSPEEFEALATLLTRFIFNIPKPYRSMIGVSTTELPTVLLLGCTMHACTIFLHSGDAGSEGVERSLKAVDNILSLLRNVSSTMDPDDDRVLGNPLLGLTLLLAARLLCARFIEEGGNATSNPTSPTWGKVEVLLGTLTRMEEGWPILGGILKVIVTEDVKRDPGP